MSVFSFDSFIKKCGRELFEGVGGMIKKNLAESNKRSRKSLSLILEKLDQKMEKWSRAFVDLDINLNFETVQHDKEVRALIFKSRLSLK